MDNHHRPSRDGATIGLRYVGDKGVRVSKRGGGGGERGGGWREREMCAICVILIVCDVTIHVYCMAPRTLTFHEN